MTRPRRTDANHAEIRNGLRKLGYTVFDRSQFGHGFPDLIVRVGADIVLLEVKQGREGLTPMEEAFAVLFPVSIVRSLDEAIAALGHASAPPPCSPAPQP